MDKPKRCCLEENKLCDGCGECDRCDLDHNKICDNCGKCIGEDGADYRALGIDDILLAQEDIRTAHRQDL